MEVLQPFVAYTLEQVTKPMDFIGITLKIRTLGNSLQPVKLPSCLGFKHTFQATWDFGEKEMGFQVGSFPSFTSFPSFHFLHFLTCFSILQAPSTTPFAAISASPAPESAPATAGGSSFVTKNVTFTNSQWQEWTASRVVAKVNQLALNLDQAKADAAFNKCRELHTYTSDKC